MEGPLQRTTCEAEGVRAGQGRSKASALQEQLPVRAGATLRCIARLRGAPVPLVSLQVGGPLLELLDSR